MVENEIIGMLSDIRCELFDLLDYNEDYLLSALKIIDSRMENYRGKSDREIAEELLINHE